MDSISHKLRAWREEQGLSLRQMAARLLDEQGQPLVSHVSLGRIERGEQPPSIPVMEAVRVVTDGEVRPDHMAAAYAAAQALRAAGSLARDAAA